MSSVNTRPLLRTLAQNPVFARPLISKNMACMGIRPFRSTATALEQFPDAESEILRAQRKLRPTSPHLSIYQPQLTWYMSGAHRLTGCALGGAFYLSAMAYLAAPAFGYHIDTNEIIASFAAAPDSVKYVTKTILAAPFVFHASNGVRHLIWDAGKCIDIKDVYTTGYAVLATTVIGTIYLAAK